MRDHGGREPQVLWDIGNGYVQDEDGLQLFEDSRTFQILNLRLCQGLRREVL